MNRRISGPGIFCCATRAEIEVDAKSEKRKRLARSASLSPLSSISCIMEYLELRMLVWMARSASEMESSDAPLGILREL